METAQVAESMMGDKLYQERARIVLPILVRQALAGNTIRYGELADEVEMPNARNLNYVLGSVGQAITTLSRRWKEKIPAIQCLVINKQTGMPGNGVGWFVRSKSDFKKLPRAQQRRIVTAELHRIFAFDRWLDVLDDLGLQPLTTNYAPLLKAAASFQGGGESKAHKKLKEYVAANPWAIGLLGKWTSTTEFPLPSGDSIDVLFRSPREWVAVEVKSHISPEADIVRGIFQCVKYRAVVDAYQVSLNLPPSARSMLVLENSLPDELVRLRTELGIELAEWVEPN